MKKTSILSLLVLATVLLFCACAPDPFPDLALYQTGIVTDIDNRDGYSTLTIADEESASTGFAAFIATVDADTPVYADGQMSTFGQVPFAVGDQVEIYMSGSTPVTASLPPQGTPGGIVLL